MAMAELVVAPPVHARLDHAAVEAARLIRVQRDRLLAETGAVTTAMLGEGRGVSVNAARQWVHRHRTAGRLITVDHEGEALIPGFQLDDAFDLNQRAAETVVALRTAGMSPWAVWRWFYTTSGWIGERPIDAAARGDWKIVEHAADRFVHAGG